MNKKKILFVVLPEQGHINPMIGVAKLLYDLKLDIAFFSQNDISEQLHKAGIQCKCYAPDQKPNIPDDFMVHGADFVEKMKDKVWMQLWIKALLIDSVPDQVEALEQVIDFFKPDVVVSDPMVYASGIVAENRGIPWAGVSNSLNPLTPQEWKSDLIETLDKYQAERLALFSTLKRDVDFRVADLISPWLNTVFTSEEYVPRHLSNNDFSFYLGTPFLKQELRGDETEFPFEKLDGSKKKVYMSLGSMVYYHPVLFRTIAKALDGFNVQLILSVGGLYEEDFSKEFTKNTIVLPYVPQLDVLDKVDLMISHGGSNSVLECLSKGIPLALLPLCNDQFFQAIFLKRAKAGIVLDAYKPDVGLYRRGLMELLKEDNTYRKNAQMIKKSLNNYNGAQEASDLIYQLLENGQPLKPILSE